MKLYELKVRMELLYIEANPEENDDHFIGFENFIDSLLAWQTWLAVKDLLKMDPKEITVNLLNHGPYSLLPDTHRIVGTDNMIIHCLGKWGYGMGDIDKWDLSHFDYAHFMEQYSNFLNYPKGS